MSHSGAFKKEAAINCLSACKDAIQLIFNSDMDLAKRTDPRYSDMIEPLESIEAVDDVNDCLNLAERKLNLKVNNKTAVNIRNLCQLKHSLAQCNDRLLRFVRMADRSKLKATVSAFEKTPIPQELVMLRNQSLEIAMKLAATTNDVLALDDEIQVKDITTDRTVLERTMEHLVVVRDNLLMHADESERLVICIKRLLYKENCSDQTAGESQDDTDGSAAIIDNTVNHNSSGETVNEASDDFFFLVGGEDEELVPAEPVSSDLDVAEDLISRRKMKRQFQPVLRELRVQLEPIELSFRKREKAALERKGIELVQLTPCGSPSSNDLLSDSGSDVDDGNIPEPKQNTQNRYDEVRNFLASKQQVLFMGNPPPTGASCQQEDIIE
ncbi:AGAP000762-PA-like protein [Anopheles sinensis]|uniref:AGAP000762-PA-like protein n=1 Tax=Anopheles sinensis TaxID=74873 RepID=A0A084VIW6_ANOSI|nr:AGAP000762-PA-like protein [Anopheles sinensis]